MRNFLSDFRFAARMLGRHPGIALAAILMFALGIGLTTTMYSIVSGALEKLPFEGSERLYHLEESRPSKGIESVAVPVHDFLDWREQQSVFEGLAAFYLATANLAGPEAPPERYEAAFISANGFEPIAVAPQMGRVFNEADEAPDAPPVVILGDSLWHNRFGGDPQLLGRTLRINGVETLVVGIMPKDFAFPVKQSLWLPLRLDPLALPRGEGPRLEVYGRLKPGRSVEEARAELGAVSQRLAQAYPESNEGVRVLIKPYIEEFIGARAPTMLRTMLGAVFGVLLIACANVANLLLARAALRNRELAVRSAFGANRKRLIQQVFVEVAVWAFAGAALGILLASAGVAFFRSTLPLIELPYWIDVRLDAKALLFAVGLAVAASLLAGLIPALRQAKGNLSEALKEQERGASGQRMSRFSRILVSAEIAVSLALLAITAFMVVGTLKLQRTDYGFSTEGLVVAQVELAEQDYPDEEQRRQFFGQLRERLRSVPGVEAAALTSALPTNHPGRWYFALEGETYGSKEAHPVTRMVTITPGFFEALGVRILDGRDLTSADDGDNLPVAIVNRSFASRHFGTDSPLGKRFRVGATAPGESSSRPWRTVVGVVPDLNISGADDLEPSGIYVPLEQRDGRVVHLLARASGDPMALAPRLRQEVAAIDPYLPVFDIETMAGVVERNTWSYSIFARLFSAFGGVAVILAAIGLYALMAFNVSRRKHEIGVRKAFGARTRDVVRLIYRQATAEMIVGFIAGLILALALGQGLRLSMYQVQPNDPRILLGVLGLMAVICGVSLILPCRRALAVTPSDALRHD